MPHTIGFIKYDSIYIKKLFYFYILYIFTGAGIAKEGASLSKMLNINVYLIKLGLLSMIHLHHVSIIKQTIFNL